MNGFIHIKRSPPMPERFINMLEDNPIIAAVKNTEQLEKALEASNGVIFLLFGSIFESKELVKKVKEKGKLCFIHFDLIEGLSKNSVALDYIHREFQPDGIITTRPNITSLAKKRGFITIQRHFIIDSISLKNTIQMISETKPDAVEVLPGVISKVIKTISQKTEIPIIAGGLISEKEDVIECLKAGVIGVSSTHPEIWGM